MFLKKTVAVLSALITFYTANAQTSGADNLTIDYQGTALVDVLEDLQERTGVGFSYSSSTIPSTQLVHAKATNATLDEVLVQVLMGFPISYERVGNRIVLRFNDLRQTVRGVLRDKDSQAPIFGGTVMVVGSNPILGSTTDQDGRFRIENVPVGRQSFRINYLGYEEAYIPNVLIGSGKEMVMNPEIVESVIRMKELVVSATGIQSLPVNEMAQISGRSFTVEETKRFPISVGDPMRLASSFAGVVSTDDSGNEIVIRGNTPRGILWRLEGVEIPSPNHFSSEGASSGGISMFSTQVISRSDFFTGAFAPEYGNATSGVFDVHMRNGNNETRENTVQLGFIGLDVATEGPFVKGKRSSYLFNYRYSTLSVLDFIGVSVQGENEKNVFQDLSFKMNFPTRSAGTFSVFGLGGLSSFRQDIPNFVEDQETYNMGVVGLSHKFIFNSTAFLNTTFSGSATRLVDDFVRDTVGVEQDFFADVTTFKKSFQRAQMVFNKKFSAKHLVEAGITLSRLTYDFNEKITNPLNSEPYTEVNLFNDKGTSGSQQGFLSWKFRLTDKLSLVNGAHWLRFDLNQESILEPRSSIKWQMSPDRSLAFGFGLHSKIESLEYYFGSFPDEDGNSSDFNTDLGLTRASHFVLSYNKQLSERTYFKTEVYYQHLFNVPILADDQRELVTDTLPSSQQVLSGFFSALNFSDGFVFEKLVNNGTGDNYGVEFTFERKFSDNFYYLLNGTFYQAKFEAADGKKRNSRFNGNYAFNLLMGKEYKVGKNGKNNIFGISGKIALAGNKRHTPININLSRQFGREIRLLDETFAERLPDYFRFDLQLSFRRNRPKTTSEWRLDIQNLTSSNNVVSEFFDGSRVRQETQIGFIPILSYRLEF